MKSKELALCALFSAMMAVCAWLSVPLFGVPVTLQTFAVFLALLTLGGKLGSISVAVYLSLGAVGLPVFSGFHGGFGAFFGATGGFLWGYLLCALMVGLLCRIPNRALVPVWLAAGGAVLYAMGCGWFAWQTHTPLWTAVAVCATPCLVGEMIKIAVATGLILSLRGRVGRILSAGVKEQRL